MSERIYQGAVYEAQCPNCNGRYLSSVDRPSQPYERCVKCLRTELNKVSASETALREEVAELRAQLATLTSDESPAYEMRPQCAAVMQELAEKWPVAAPDARGECEE